MTDPETSGINRYAEKSLHIALKDYLAHPGDRFEVEVDGFVVDMLRGEQIIEIQTQNFSALKRKLNQLIQAHSVRLIYPIALERWIIKGDSRRRSPKRGHVTHVFNELVYLHHLMAYPNFSLQVLMIRDEEIRINDGKGSWRRGGWSIQDRRLLDVVESVLFETVDDLKNLLPDELPATFTAAQLASCLKQKQPVAQRMVYCLRHMGAITQVGKLGRAYLYAR
ncbi:MAG: hypothetical protein Kow00117_18170 [Phototrophicales bacterium]